MVFSETVEEEVECLQRSKRQRQVAGCGAGGRHAQARCVALKAARVAVQQAAAVAAAATATAATHASATSATAIAVTAAEELASQVSEGVRGSSGPGGEEGWRA
jgi:hypothetical protein